MKTRIYLLAIAFVCSVAVSFTQAQTVVQLKDDGTNIGSAGTDPGRISTVPPTLVLTGGSRLEASFKSGGDAVKVTIRNSSGVAVYRRVVDTSSTSDLSINVANLPASEYTVSFTNSADGSVKSGDFVID